MSRQFETTVLNPGVARAKTLVLDDALSFWGGYDPRTGEIIDQHHPQRGERISGRVLVLPRSRGSAGTPAGIAESILKETGPAAVILRHSDINIAIGMMVADELYQTQTPVVLANRDDYHRLKNNILLRIQADGIVFVE